MIELWLMRFFAVNIIKIQYNKKNLFSKSRLFMYVFLFTNLQWFSVDVMSCYNAFYTYNNYNIIRINVNIYTLFQISNIRETIIQWLKCINSI